MKKKTWSYAQLKNKAESSKITHGAAADDEEEEEKEEEEEEEENVNVSARISGARA